VSFPHAEREFLRIWLKLNSCTRNVKIVPDIKSIDELPPESNTDILILPGGAPGAKTFCEDSRVQRLIHSYRVAGKHTAFICAATTALVASTKWAERIEGLQISQKVRVTSHPSVKKEIVDAGWQYAPDEERVVVDDKVITSRGPGTALLFSLTIVEELCGKAKRNEITGPLMCAKEL
jgi:protein DJ-1